MRCVLSACPLAVSSDCSNVSPEAGSGSCKARPACTNSDYFYTHTPCDYSRQVLSSKTCMCLGEEGWIELHLHYLYFQSFSVRLNDLREVEGLARIHQNWRSC